MSQQNILLIEDDPDIGRILQKSLQREGFGCAWRTNGTDGIAYARDHNPHLIILDIRLPDMLGFDVCRRLRQLQLRQPILILSVQGDDIDKIIGLETGADDYLTKPYNFRMLLARVRALLRRAYGDLATENSDVLYAGDMLIDRSSGQVKRGNQIINLTPTEFRLLVHLAQNKGQALSRGQLLNAVWGYDGGDENTVMVHVRRLRQKIEIDPSKPQLLRTVPGLGYRFVG